MADRPDGRTDRQLSIDQRLAAIDQRLEELRQAKRRADLRQARPGDLRPATAMELVLDAQQRAREADRHWQDSIAYALRVKHFVAQAFQDAAKAHDHAADANERSARAGIGNVAEHKRLAEFHREAAEADRQRAEEIQRQEAEDLESPG